MINRKVSPGSTSGFKILGAQILKPIATLMSALVLASAAWAQPVVTSAALTSTAVAPGGTVAGTLIYNTASVVGPTGVKPGLYFWTGTEWRLADAKFFNVNSALANSQAVGVNSVAIGPAATAGGANDIALGLRAAASNGNSIAIGLDAAATSTGGVGAVAIGGGDTGFNSPITGNTNPLPNKLNIATRAGTAVGFGSQANAPGDGGGSAFGTYALTNRSTYNTAIGYRADASVPSVAALGGYGGAVVVGAFSFATEVGATVLGANSRAVGTNTVALGNFSVANRVAGSVGFSPLGASGASIGAINATNSTFLGGVSVGGGSVAAIGGGTTQLGNRQITNVAAGTSDSDAVNVSQLKALSAVVAALPAGGTGVPGPAGPAGPVGPVGPIGAAGPAGGTGAVGPAGAAGSTGTSGTNGSNGAPGLPGVPGAAGATGATGPQGIQGPAGTPSAAPNPVTVVQGNNIVASVAPDGSQISIATAPNVTFTGVTTANITVGQGAKVALGNNVVTQVAPGVAPTDAANMAQLNNVSEQSRQYTDGRVNQLSNEVVANRRDANAGTAAAMAMAGMPQAFAPGRSMAAAGVASFEGQTAVAVGVSRLSETGQWLIKINGAATSRGKVGASIGAGFSW